MSGGGRSRYEDLKAEKLEGACNKDELEVSQRKQDRKSGVFGG
jgi:hypothetical protein